MPAVMHAADHAVDARGPTRADFCIPAPQETAMPEKKTIERARRDKAQGKSATTQAGEFVREEVRHIRVGKHGARSAKQAVAIGLSKARRAGVDLPPPKRGSTSERTRKSAAHDRAQGKRRTTTAPSPRRSRATTTALKREGHTAASKPALARHARASARGKSARARSLAAKKAAATRARMHAEA
jgi:hypothetical protein